MSRPRKPLNVHLSHTEVIFSMSHYLVQKAELIKRKECWHEAHDRRILADREYTDEVLGVGGTLGCPDLGELT